MKKLFLSLLIAVSLIAFASCEPNDFDSGNNEPKLKFSLKDDGTYAVELEGVKNVSSVVIPETYNGKPVTAIGDSAFRACTGLNVIVIPDSVTSIGSYAFAACDSLTSIEIPDSVTKIGDNAFWACSSLASIEIPDSVTEISDSAFANCESLTSVEIPDGVTTIGKWAFSHCESLTSVEMPDGVTTIGYGAFSYCTSLTSVEIPDSVTMLGDYAFSHCRALKELYFNATAMDYLNSYNYVFYHAGNIKVVIGANVTQVPSYLFCPSTSTPSASPKITSVEFEEGSVCEAIGYFAFYSCSTLASVVIPDSVTSIGSYAFANCDGLEIIKYRGTEEQWNAVIKESEWNYNTDDYTVIYDYDGE